MRLLFLLLAFFATHIAAEEVAPQSNMDMVGLWQGKSEQGHSITSITLDDGRFFVVYSNDSQTSLAGIIAGNFSQHDDMWHSNDALDYSLNEHQVMSASLSVSLLDQLNLKGVISYENDQLFGFTSQFNPAFNNHVPLTELKGGYHGKVQFGPFREHTAVFISQTGEVVGMGNSGCQFMGKLAETNHGPVFDLNVEFINQHCDFAEQTLHGAAYFDLAQRRIYAIIISDDRKNGMLFIGDHD